MRKSIFLTSIVILILASANAWSQQIDTLKIYFGIDQSAITETNSELLSGLMLRPELRDVKIFAYTDFLGSVDHNQQLSQNRAEAVKNYLILNGLTQSKITKVNAGGIHSFSSYENRSNQSDRGIPEHRMVEIIFTYNVIIETVVIELEVPEQQVEIINTAPEDKPVVIDLKNINATNLVEGSKIVLKNINFEGGTPTFKPESDEALKDLLDVMRRYPNLKIEIQGHICCQDPYDPDGYDSINDDNNLSKNRARAVFEYLRDNGVEINRMTYVGFAARYKLYPNENNSFEQSQNRRVEIKIVEN